MSAEQISLVSDIAIIVSVAVVAVAALYGLRTWRRDVTGRAKFDAARNVIFLSFKLRDDFKKARNPLSYSFESAERSRKESESAEEARELDGWYTRGRRLQPLIEDLQRIEEAGWMAEAVLGGDTSKQVSQAVVAFRRSFADLSSAINSYFETKHQEAIAGERYHDQDWLRELSKIIYWAEGDSFSKQLDETVDNLANILKAYVR